MKKIAGCFFAAAALVLSAGQVDGGFGWLVLTPHATKGCAATTLVTRRLDATRAVAIRLVAALVAEARNCWACCEKAITALMTSSAR